jgi:hypothetical protein
VTPARKAELRALEAEHRPAIDESSQFERPLCLIRAGSKDDGRIVAEVPFHEGEWLRRYFALVPELLDAADAMEREILVLRGANHELASQRDGFRQDSIRSERRRDEAEKARGFFDGERREVAEGIRVEQIEWASHYKEAVERAAAVEAALEIARGALLLVEWIWKSGREWTACPRCDGDQPGPDRIFGKGHDPDCPVDAALIAVGLPDQASRDTARHVRLRNGSGHG